MSEQSSEGHMNNPAAQDSPDRIVSLGLYRPETVELLKAAAGELAVSVTVFDLDDPDQKAEYTHQRSVLKATRRTMLSWHRSIDVSRTDFTSSEIESMTAVHPEEKTDLRGVVIARPGNHAPDLSDFWAKVRKLSRVRTDVANAKLVD